MSQTMETEAPHPLDKYMTIAEAADFLRCTRDKIYRLGRQDRLNIIKYFGRRYVERATVQQVLDEELSRTGRH